MKFYVDNKEYETELTTIIGAQVLAYIGDYDESSSLFLEGEGDNPDIPIFDDTTFDMVEDMRFYLVPPATAG